MAFAKNNISFAERLPMKIQKIEYIIKHNAFAQKAYVYIASAGFKVIGLFVKPDDKQVLFNSLIGKNYGDSPRAIFEAIKKDHFFDGYKYIWAFDNPNSFQVDGAKKVKINSLKYFITALKSGVWISNVNIERGLQFKPRSTVYLNTWHGCAPLKVDGNAQKNRNDYDYSDVDIFCSNSEWQDDCFVKNYKAKKESIIRCGMPRNDVLYDVSEERIKSLRDKYSIPKEKKVILYAPTWRESSDGGNSRVFTPPINIDYWREQLADEYVLLFRMHHLTTKAMNIDFNDFVRDYSGPYDINELMTIADILITDYSSTLTDYAILEKPVLLFAYDYDDYYNTRGLYMRLEELLPGYICSNEEELIKSIHELDVEKASALVKSVKHKYVQGNGNSTSLCIEALKNMILDKHR